VSETISYSGVLVVQRCWCGIRFAIPEELLAQQIADQDRGVQVRATFCPLGHEGVPSGETKAQKLERQLQRERAAADQVRAALNDERRAHERTEARRRGQAAAKTRVMNRVAKGVCPCCSRTFQNMARHMACKHPEVASAGSSPDA